MNKQQKKEHAWGRLDRDDVAYTDDIIATLQAPIDPREKADVLRVPDWDVAYHVAEVAGWSHHGAVIRKPSALLRDWYGKPEERTEQVAPSPLASSPYPTDRTWWSARTLEEAAAELDKPIDVVRIHARNAGMQFKLVRRVVAEDALRVAVPFTYEAPRLFNPYTPKPKPTLPTEAQIERARQQAQRAMLRRFAKEDRAAAKKAPREKSTKWEKGSEEYKAYMREYNRTHRKMLTDKQRQDHNARRRAMRARERQARIDAGESVRPIYPKLTDEERSEHARIHRRNWYERKRQERIDAGAVIKTRRRKLTEEQRREAKREQNQTYKAALRAVKEQELATAGVPPKPKLTEAERMAAYRERRRLQKQRARAQATPEQRAQEAARNRERRLRETERKLAGVSILSVRNVHVDAETLKARVPSDPAWWYARTIRQAAEELGTTVYRVRRALRLLGIQLEKTKRTHGVWPTDPEWWAARTTREIATELNRANDTVAKYARAHGYTVKPLEFRPYRDTVRRRQVHRDFPTDPAWWAVRTMRQIMTELRVKRTTLRSHIQKRGYQILHIVAARKQKSNIRGEKYPTDPSWWSARTLSEAAQELGINRHVVYVYARDHGYTLILQKRIKRQWPTDAAWYADRTVADISRELGIPPQSVRNHVWANQLQYKRER